eukprot:scaffold69465_cov38-Tisochrysis_lutea.AAC.5
MIRTSTRHGLVKHDQSLFCAADSMQRLRQAHPALKKGGAVAHSLARIRECASRHAQCAVRCRAIAEECAEQRRRLGSVVYAQRIGLSNGMSVQTDSQLVRGTLESPVCLEAQPFHLPHCTQRERRVEARPELIQLEAVRTVNLGGAQCGAHRPDARR